MSADEAPKKKRRVRRRRRLEGQEIRRPSKRPRRSAKAEGGSGEEGTRRKRRKRRNRSRMPVAERTRQRDTNRLIVKSKLMLKRAEQITAEILDDFAEAGVSREDIEQWMSDPSKYSDEDWKLIQEVVEQSEKDLAKHQKKTVNEVRKEDKEKKAKKKTRKVKGRGLGARKGWMPM